MLTFLSLVCIALALSGVLAFGFFWPMALVHLRDRHRERLAAFGSAAFASPAALYWLLGGHYRGLADPSLNGLCTPARVSLWSVIVALVAAALLGLVGRGLGP